MNVVVLSSHRHAPEPALCQAQPTCRDLCCVKRNLLVLTCFVSSSLFLMPLAMHPASFNACNHHIDEHKLKLSSKIQVHKIFFLVHFHQNDNKCVMHGFTLCSGEYVSYLLRSE